MGKANDIIRRGSERVAASGETARHEAKVLKKIEDSRDYVDAKSALKKGNYPDKQAKKELKELAKETRKSQTSWAERYSAKVDIAMRTSRRPDDDSSEKSICFIATVVYGDVNAPQVEALRNYRDDVMMRSPMGRGLIELYYNGLGEGVAYFMRDKAPELIPLARRCLDCFIERVEVIKE